MTIRIRATIESIGPAKLARATGFPLSTIFRWMKEDRIPGGGASHDMRVQKFTEAVNAIRAEEAAQPKPEGRSRAQRNRTFPKQAAA